MTNDNLRALLAIVRAALETQSERHVVGIIDSAHNGRLRGFVSTHNLYLFRQYRNQVSPRAEHMVEAAKNPPYALEEPADGRPEVQR